MSRVIDRCARGTKVGRRTQLQEATRPGALCACVCTRVCTRMCTHAHVPSHLISSVSKPPALRGPACLFILSRGGWALRAAQRRAQGQALGETRSGAQALVSQEWGRMRPFPPALGAALVLLSCWAAPLRGPRHGWGTVQLCGPLIGLQNEPLASPSADKPRPPSAIKFNSFADNTLDPWSRLRV